MDKCVQTGPSPNNGFTIVVVLKTQPWQSIECVVVQAGTLMVQPKRRVSVIMEVHGTKGPPGLKVGVGVFAARSTS